jgi:transcriptional regulator with XRE-family HTH domain
MSTLNELPGAVVDVPFLQRCLEAGQMNLKDLANALGISTRTVSRWYNGAGGFLTPQQYHRLARAMARHDLALADEIARLGGTTLEALDLGPRALAAASAASNQAVAVPPGAMPVAYADVVLCTVAERLDLSPRQLRPILAAAFARAHELGLTTEMLARAFADSDGKRPTPPAAAPLGPR